MSVTEIRVEYYTDSHTYEMFKHLRREHGWTKKRLFAYFKYVASKSTLEGWWYAVIAGGEK